MEAHEYRLGYRADLEGLRAVAVLLVVAAHAGVPWLRGGFVGVDVFFVLSGFLITGLLLRELGQDGSIRFGEFYVRRLRRLLPGLLAMVVLVSVAASLLMAPGTQQSQAIAAGSAMFWSSNIRFAFARLDYFSSGAEGNLFLHTWSLGVEEQFYLLWPGLVVWAWGRGTGGLRRVKIVMGATAAASFVACVVLTQTHPRLAFYMMPVRAWQFAAGALIWLYLRGSSMSQSSVDAPAREWRALGWLGLAGVLASALALTPDAPYPGGRAMVPTLGAVAVIAAGTRGAGGVSRLLAWSPFQALGRVSYAWYLWHWPVLLFARALYPSDGPIVRASAVAISLVFAVASYRLVEAPTRHRRIWLQRPRMTVVAALAVMGLAAILCLRWYNRASDLEHSPQYQRLAHAHADAPVIYGMGCDEWHASDALRVCGFGRPDAPRTAVLLGDSVAGQWFSAVAAVYDKPDWRLLVITKSACPMVDEPIFYALIGHVYETCSTWRRRAVRYVSALKPDAVILGSVFTYSFTQRQWIDGTSRILAPLAAASKHVYVLRSTPLLPFDGPDCLAAHQGRPSWLGASGACSSLAANGTNDAVYGWLKEAGRPYPNVSTIDLNGEVCPSGICQAQRNGIIVFRDSQHMTATFAASLTPALAARLRQPAWAGN